VLSIGLLVGLGAVVYFGLAWLTGAIDRGKIAMLTRKTAAQDAIT
jgi:putative peptidoglycan lipid II flippase